jgi:hypothetical protein
MKNKNNSKIAMDVKNINMILSEIVEQMTGDENEPDEFGMDVATRKRLRVKNKFSKKMKNKPVKPTPSFLPYSLSNL